jgi:hypothetical protein
LSDAERLFLELHSNDGDGKIDVVGYSIVERLNRLVDVNDISEDLVKDHSKARFGHRDVPQNDTEQNDNSAE